MTEKPINVDLVYEYTKNMLYTQDGVEISHFTSGGMVVALVVVLRGNGSVSVGSSIGISVSCGVGGGVSGGVEGWW